MTLLQELAHDLRTPVASLKNMLETMLHSRGDDRSRRSARSCSTLSVREAEYFERLVEDLLVLAQVTEPRYRAGADRVALDELVEEEAESVAALRRREGARRPNPVELSTNIVDRASGSLRGSPSASADGPQCADQRVLLRQVGGHRRSRARRSAASSSSRFATMAMALARSAFRLRRAPDQPHARLAPSGSAVRRSGFGDHAHRSPASSRPRGGAERVGRRRSLRDGVPSDLTRHRGLSVAPRGRDGVSAAVMARRFRNECCTVQLAMREVRA